jgi:hypothetical protein
MVFIGVHWCSLVFKWFHEFQWISSKKVAHVYFWSSIYSPRLKFYQPSTVSEKIVNLRAKIWTFSKNVRGSGSNCLQWVTMWVTIWAKSQKGKSLKINSLPRAVSGPLNVELVSNAGWYERGEATTQHSEYHPILLWKPTRVHGKINKNLWGVLMVFIFNISWI